MTKNWTVAIAASLAAVLGLFVPALIARADIFEWEYINPANPGEGKQQSAMLAPDGAGASAVPAADLSFRNLTMAYLIGADLRGATVHAGYLRNAELSQANLTEANFSTNYTEYPDLPYSTDMTDANLTQANLTHANFGGYLGSDGEGDYYFSGANLTGANLQQANLTGADFWVATLTNANLGQANLAHASFSAADLTGADLTGAEVRGASFNRESLDGPFPDWVGGITLVQLYSTASYQAGNLTGIRLQINDLSGGNFIGQNLTNADFSFATLTGANLSGAEVLGADLRHSGITAAQLYSTVSYQAHDLSGIKLLEDDNQFAGVNLAGQNLTNATIGRNLTNANLSQANLTNADFAGYLVPIYDEYGNYLGDVVSPGANLTNANLSGADARGANFQYATLSGANTGNLIQSNGHIAGLDLSAGASLIVRDYDDGIPIAIEQNLTTDAAGTLRLEFDADPWDSTISFESGISVALGGTLELTFADGTDVASQIGRTIDLFDWSGVTPTGAFTVSSPYTWNQSNLYTTGEVTLLSVGLSGDFDGDGDVDGRDFLAWQRNPSVGNLADWQANYGTDLLVAANVAVPEPSTVLLLILVTAGGYVSRRMD